MTDDEKTKRTNGDGSVYYRKSDDRWCASLSLPSDDGRPRRVTRTVPKKGTARQQEAAAKALLTRLIRERNDNGDIPTATLNVEKWARKWLDQIVFEENRPKTARTYRTNVEQYIIPAIGTRQLRKLTPDDVRQVDKFIKAKGLTRTRASAYQTLSQLLESARAEGHVTRNVAEVVNRPRTAKAELTVLTVDHALNILRVTTGWPPPVAIDRLASRWWTALFTGARQGEVIGLEWDRVDFERGILDLSWQLQRVTWDHGCGKPIGTDLIKGQNGKRDRTIDLYSCGRKRGNECPKRTLNAPADWEHRPISGGLWWSRPKSMKGWRIIPLISPLREALELRLQASVLEPNPHGLVWTQPNGRALDPRADNEAWHDVLALAGAPDARLHDARHTTASLLLKAGVPIEVITKILGHSTYAMSREYIDVDMPQLADGMTRMSALLLESSPRSV